MKNNSNSNQKKNHERAQVANQKDTKNQAQQQQFPLITINIKEEKPKRILMQIQDRQNVFRKDSQAINYQSCQIKMHSASANNMLPEDITHSEFTEIIEGHSQCPECLKDSKTIVESYSSGTQCGWCTFMALGGCWPLCFIPFLIPSCHKKVYRCKECRKIKKRYDPPCFICCQDDNDALLNSQ